MEPAKIIHVIEAVLQRQWLQCVYCQLSIAMQQYTCFSFSAYGVFVSQYAVIKFAPHTGTLYNEVI